MFQLAIQPKLMEIRHLEEEGKHFTLKGNPLPHTINLQQTTSFTSGLEM